MLGAPLAFFVMSKWLDGFAYRINIEPSFFALALMFTVTAMALAVGYQIIAAARTNPTKSLRAE